MFDVVIDTTKHSCRARNCNLFLLTRRISDKRKIELNLCVYKLHLTHMLDPYQIHNPLFHIANPTLDYNLTTSSQGTDQNGLREIIEHF